VAFTQGQPRRYRFAYTKLGASSILSHLDLIRALPRTFRRLDLPLFYSTGFHPKPDMTFGPALSLGVASLVELVDVKLTSDLDPDALLGPLSDASPEGMRFVAARRLGERDASISRVINTARYAIALPKSALREHGGDGWLAGRLALALEASELKMLRTIEGIGRWIDVRAFMRGMTLETASARAAVEAAGLVGDFSVLEVDLEIRGSGAIKVSEVVAALTGLSDFPHRAVRFALGEWRPLFSSAAGDPPRRDAGTVVSPLDLHAVRNRPPRDAVVSTRSAEPA
jgi:radical SAM-linked protein